MIQLQLFNEDPIILILVPLFLPCSPFVYFKQDNFSKAESEHKNS